MTDTESLERRLDKGLELGYATVAAMRIETIARDAVALLKQRDAEIKRIQAIGDHRDLLQAENERLRDALERLDQWSKAYPIDIFPEPDLKDARAGLAQVGITLGQVSASNMRHVIKRVGEIARAALEGEDD